MLRETIDSKKGLQADQSLTASWDALLLSVIRIALCLSPWHFHEFEFSLCGDIPIQQFKQFNSFTNHRFEIHNERNYCIFHFTEFISGTRMEQWNRREHYLAFFVFHFRFGRKKTKNLNRKRLKIPQNSEFGIIWNFWIFVFSKIWSFYLWCIKSRSIPSDRDRSSKNQFFIFVKFSFSVFCFRDFVREKQKIPITAIQK